MSNAPTLRGRVHQNLYVPAGTRRVEALIDVDATGGAREVVEAPDAVEVIVIDVSGSMADPPDKIRAARQATAAAIDEVRDGTRFAVVAGSHVAEVISPPVPADTTTRTAAKAELARLVPGGGTAIGTWLKRTAELVAEHPGAIRHAILLTDGRNEHESEAELAAAVDACAGLFRCDCRGVGADWSAAELRLVARGLLGSFGRIAEPSGMAADFRALMAASMRKEVAEIALRVWTPVGATVELVKQVAPDTVDLTARRADGGPQVGLYPTGAWGTEQRDFHIAVAVPPAGVDQERLACRVSFVQLQPDGPPQPLAQSYFRTRPDGSSETHREALVSAIWTDDVARDTTPHLRVLASLDQNAVEAAVDQAAAAYEAGDHAAAAQRLTEVRPIAERAGMTALVARIDDLLDPETGTGRFTDADILDLSIESSRLPTREDGSA